jgi:hypothetical protein
MNPISLQTTISARLTAPKTGTAPPLAPDPRDTHLRETMPAYIVAGKYLLAILTEEIRTNTTPEVFNKYDSTESIINAFRRQFASYTCQEPPFIYANKVEPLAYWKSLATIEEASILAVCKSVRHLSTCLHPSVRSWASSCTQLCQTQWPKNALSPLSPSSIQQSVLLRKRTQLSTSPKSNSTCAEGQPMCVHHLMRYKILLIVYFEDTFPSCCPIL